jgi:hypothetical protein
MSKCHVTTERTERIRQRTDQPPADTKDSEIINFVLFAITSW